MSNGPATTHFFTDLRCLEHEAGVHHPESPARLATILRVLASVPVSGVVQQSPRFALPDELKRVHGARYVDSIVSMRGRAVQLDPDTAMSRGSVDAALLAAGAAMQAVEEVMAKRVRTAFAAVRPPGHHAEVDHAMGFCLFNNVAVAAEHAKALGAQRVAIVDWDVHHGNGTQHTFALRDDVLFISLHQFPFYPGTGAAHEIGSGAGAGFTINVPLPGQQTDADYGACFETLVLPALSQFKPDLILVSAGFDPHQHDPLGGMRLTERGFAAMCSALLRSAQSVCEGRLVLLLEGGYHLEALANSVHACLEVLSGARTESLSTAASTVAGAVIDDVRAAHGSRWTW